MVHSHHHHGETEDTQNGWRALEDMGLTEKNISVSDNFYFPVTTYLRQLFLPDNSSILLSSRLHSTPLHSYTTTEKVLTARELGALNSYK